MIDGTQRNRGTHGYEGAKETPANFFSGIFQCTLARAKAALSFTYQYVGFFAGKVISCLNGCLFKNAEKGKTSQEKTGEKTDSAASKVLGKDKPRQKEEDLYVNSFPFLDDKKIPQEGEREEILKFAELHNSLCPEEETLPFQKWDEFPIDIFEKTEDRRDPAEGSSKVAERLLPDEGSFPMFTDLAQIQVKFSPLAPSSEDSSRIEERSEDLPKFDLLMNFPNPSISESSAQASLFKGEAALLIESEEVEDAGKKSQRIGMDNVLGELRGLHKKKQEQLVSEAQDEIFEKSSPLSKELEEAEVEFFPLVEISGASSSSEKSRIDQPILDLSKADEGFIGSELPAASLPNEASSSQAQELVGEKEEVSSLVENLGESSLLTKSTMEKMLSNTEEALALHLARAKSSEKEAFLNFIPPIDTFFHPESSVVPLTFDHNVLGRQGRRKKMEDAHFYNNDLACGLFMGVLDGHGGADVASYSAKRSQELFQEFFDRNGGDVYNTFKALTQHIEQEVENEHSEWNEQGSTAVLSFVDRSTRLIYTATLGDSEATIYRKVNGQFKAIPLSCLRDWSSLKDAKRATLALNQSSWSEEDNLQYLRLPGRNKYVRYPGLPPEYAGVNVSRSIGDVTFRRVKENKDAPDAISEKPKITVHQLEPGDVLIVACDGLHDYVRQDQIIETLSASFEGVSHRLVNKAIGECSSGDNVTVLAVLVK